MDFSTMSASGRSTLVAGAIVTVTPLLSISNEWGLLMAVSLLGGIGAIALELSPAINLPATRGVSALVLGGMATVATTLVAINWLGWIVEHLVSFDTIQFLTGLVAAVALLGIGSGRYQAERSTAVAAAA